MEFAGQGHPAFMLVGFLLICGGIFSHEAMEHGSRGRPWALFVAAIGVDLFMLPNLNITAWWQWPLLAIAAPLLFALAGAWIEGVSRRH